MPRGGLWWMGAALALLVAACGDDGRRRTGGGGEDGGADGARACTSDEECDDGLQCTLDTCGVGNRCRNRPLDELCPDGQRCLPGVGEAPSGCSDAEVCTSDEACDDGLACTVDACGADMRCRHEPVHARCEAGQLCDPARGGPPTGCAEAPEGSCRSDADCDDMVPCTVDSCGADMRCRHDPIDARCGDGERCDVSAGCVAPMACSADEDCDDGLFCNGAERCSAEFGCMAGTPPACDDGDPCTIDGCSDELGRCTFTCDSTNPACECPVETPCSGTFRLDPVPMGSCALGMVAFNVEQVTFSCVGPVLSVDGGSIPSVAANTPMTQNPRPTDGTFSVEAVISGGCTETYRLEGAFTGPDTFTATFTATYTDTDGLSCGLGGCANRSWMVTGTRVP